METATVSPLDFHFRSWRHMLGGWHILVFYREVCMQHLCIYQPPSSALMIDLDLTLHSKNTGKFDADVAKRLPHFKLDEWEAPIFFYEREDDLNVYLASRFETAKDSDLSQLECNHIIWAIRGNQDLTVWKNYQ